MWRAIQVAILLCVVTMPTINAAGEKYKPLSKKAKPAKATPLAAAASTAAAAAEYNRQALEHAYAGDLGSALGLFEKAVSSFEYAEYISNVGVTLMRMGRSMEAKVAFEHALRLDPNFQNAQDNLKELVDWMKARGLLEESYDIAVGVAAAAANGSKVKLSSSAGDVSFAAAVEVEEELEPVERVRARPVRRGPSTTRDSFGHLQHHTEPLPRISFRDLDSPAMAEFAFGLKPFVITDLLSSPEWAASEAMTAWNFKWFADRFGDKTADFYPANMAHVGVHPYLIPLAQALDEATSPSDNFPKDPEHPGTYLQWNINFEDWKSVLSNLGPIPSMFKDFQTWMEECFPTPFVRNTFSHVTHWHMVLFGTQGAGMFNHWDIMQSASWQAQITGRKLWHLCSPENNDFLYLSGDVDTFNPDYDRFPNVREANCFLDVVEAGEFVFYPAGWWHQTENLAKENIAIVGSVVDANCFELVINEIEKDCNAKVKRFQFKEPVCKVMRNSCFPWWQQAFQGTFSPKAKTTCKT